MPTKSAQNLRQERGLINAVVETAVDGFITIDANGDIIWVNQATTHIFGYTLDELVGQNVRMLMPTALRGPHDQGLEDYLETGERKIIGIGREVQGLRKNGEIFPLDVAVSETLTEAGPLFTGIVRDITERKRVEEECAVTNSQLQQMLDHSPAVLYCLRMVGEQAIPILVSENIVRFLDYTLEATKSFAWWYETLHPDDRQRAAASLGETISLGTSKSEFRLRHRDGTYRWVEDNRRLVKRAEGEPVELIGVWTDITDRVRTEEAARQVEERLRLVIDNMTEGVVIADVDGQVVHWNKSALDIHDVSCEADWNIKLPRFLEFFELSTLDGVVLGAEDWPLSRILKGERISDLDLRVRRLDSDWARTFRYGGSLVQPTGGRQLAFVTMSDITERESAIAALTERATELERFHRISVGRELRMIELKREVNELAHLLGRSPPYDSSLFEEYTIANRDGQ